MKGNEHAISIQSVLFPYRLNSFESKSGHEFSANCSASNASILSLSSMTWRRYSEEMQSWHSQSCLENRKRFILLPLAFVFRKYLNANCIWFVNCMHHTKENTIIIFHKMQIFLLSDMAFSGMIIDSFHPFMYIFELFHIKKCRKKETLKHIWGSFIIATHRLNTTWTAYWWIKRMFYSIFDLNLKIDIFPSVNIYSFSLTEKFPSILQRLFICTVTSFLMTWKEFYLVFFYTLH